MITSKGIRDRSESIHRIKHPQRQRDELFKLIADIGGAIETMERVHEQSIQRLVGEHRAECAALEKRFNERFTCQNKTCKGSCVCHAPTA